MAEEFIERMVSHGSMLDEELEEFVQPTIPDAQFLANEVDTLFDAPFEEHELDEANTAILALMTFEGNRKDYIKELKAGGMTLEEAKDTYKDELAHMVKAALPEQFSDEEE
jgi:polyhydroxyalkanoate synthesis regulator phasin